MMLRQVLEIADLLESAAAGLPERTAAFLKERGCGRVELQVPAADCKTTFIRCVFPGSAGRIAGGGAPTLGVVGQLGGIRMDSERPGLVSDADGAVVALSLAAKLAEMNSRGMLLQGDVIVTTHLCPDARSIPHKPVDFVDMPMPIGPMQKILVDPAMDAVISVDATKGNRILSHNGIAITPVAREGYILPVSRDLLDLTESVTGETVVMLPLTTQDLTPYYNGLTHLNSIMQPATVTGAPVLGLAIAAGTVVAGTATNANQFAALEAAARFCLEAAIRYADNRELFHDEAEFRRLKQRYGTMSIAGHDADAVGPGREGMEP